jgi:hypothetical protein
MAIAKNAAFIPFFITSSWVESGALEREIFLLLAGCLPDWSEEVCIWPVTMIFLEKYTKPICLIREQVVAEKHNRANIVNKCGNKRLGKNLTLRGKYEISLI